MARTSNECEKDVIRELEFAGYRVYKRGWPDLIAVDKETDEVRFIEVKPVTKKLKKYQKIVKDIFGMVGLKYEVFYVERIGNRVIVHINEKPDIYKKHGPPTKKEYAKRLKELEL